MKNRIILSLAFIFTIAFFSCKKDEQQTSTVTEHVNSMSAFNAAHKKPTQNFTLDATTGGVITTTGGIEFYFPVDAFANSSGNIVSGTVDIKIDEVISIADLFFNQISTHVNGRPLKSGGAFKISVTQGSDVLKIATGKHYNVLLTSNSPEQTPTMETYYGIPTNDQYGILNWSLTPPGIAPTVFTNTTDTSNIYNMVLDKFDWINCDHPYDSLFSELSITLPSGIENPQITVLDNSIMTAVSIWNNGNTAKWSYAPLNRQLTVVALFKANEEYKVSAQTFYFTGQQINLPGFTTISEADLETMINSF